MRRQPLSFPSDGETLAGELLLPAGEGRHPAVLLVGGTFGDTRDGDSEAALRGAAPKSGKLRILAEHLAAHGLASLRWDKRGVGESSGPNRDEHSDLWTDVADIHQALRALRAAEGVDASRVALLGHSAGGHHLCLLARRLDAAEQPAAFVMHSALYASLYDLLEFNSERLLVFCARGPDEDAWVRQVAPGAYQMARQWRDFYRAAERGEDVYVAADGGYWRPLRRLKQEIEFAPADQFRYLQRPTLVIQGDHDMNVSPDDCYHIAQAIRAAGNPHVTLVVVPRADHSMNLAPADAEARLRQRITFDSYRNPTAQFFLHALTGWLLDTLGIASL
ncbi:MAG: alpha/beta fold hydrolase [Anaerolineae bacterium]|nr:alpha/beta fold hydrolase [Anaerolineae bacterium]